MIFNGRPISRIPNKSIQNVVDARRGEGMHLEFKRLAGLGDPVQITKLLKGVTAFANAEGGYILIGVAEKRGRAHAFHKLLDPEKTARTIRDLCRDHVAPPIAGLEVGIRRPGGFVVVVLRIPASERKPHMVTFQSSTHFVIRDGDSKRPMTYEEVRWEFEHRLVRVPDPREATLLRRGGYNKRSRPRIAARPGRAMKGVK